MSHEFNFWADILRVKDNDGGISRAFYINWIKDSLAENKPYDRFVRELVTASGSGWQARQRAVGYYFRDRGMPLDNMANTMRIFTGTRLACAQCHDHPHDKWTRRQMFEMAAFTANLKTDNNDDVFRAIVKMERFDDRQTSQGSIANPAEHVPPRPRNRPVRRHDPVAGRLSIRRRQASRKDQGTRHLRPEVIAGRR